MGLGISDVSGMLGKNFWPVRLVGAGLLVAAAIGAVAQHQLFDGFGGSSFEAAATGTQRAVQDGNARAVLALTSSEDIRDYGLTEEKVGKLLVWFKEHGGKFSGKGDFQHTQESGFLFSGQTMMAFTRQPNGWKADTVEGLVQGVIYSNHLDIQYLPHEKDLALWAASYRELGPGLRSIGLDGIVIQDKTQSWESLAKVNQSEADKLATWNAAHKTR